MLFDCLTFQEYNHRTFDTTVVFAILLCGEVVRISVASVEREGLARARRRIVVPASDSRTADGARLVAQRASVS